MRNYFEFVFIINFLLDFMILYGTKRILKRNVTCIRLIIGSLFGSISTFFVFFSLSSFDIFLLKVILSICIIFISFGFKGFFNNWFYFYLISIIFGGVIYLLDLKQNNYFYYICLIGICFLVIYFLIRLFLQYKNKIVSVCSVRILYKNKEYKLEGFIDTGNRLISPFNGESIILVNIDFNPSKVIYVPYKVLNGSGIIPCIHADHVFVNEREVFNCLIGMAKSKFSINGFDCILPNKLREELCLE